MCVILIGLCSSIESVSIRINRQLEAFWLFTLDVSMSVLIYLSIIKHCLLWCATKTWWVWKLRETTSLPPKIEAMHLSLLQKMASNHGPLDSPGLKFITNRLKDFCDLILLNPLRNLASWDKRMIMKTNTLEIIKRETKKWNINILNIH